MPLQLLSHKTAMESSACDGNLDMMCPFLVFAGRQGCKCPPPDAGWNMILCAPAWIPPIGFILVAYQLCPDWADWVGAAVGYT
eukprot:11672758-Ditylum_brightwellii.AAC.1